MKLQTLLDEIRRMREEFEEMKALQLKIMEEILPKVKPTREKCY